MKDSKLSKYQEYYKLLSDPENVSLNFGPVTDAEKHPLEQIYLANIFKHLADSPKFSKYKFYLISANSPYEFAIDKSCVVFYLSNEDHDIPENVRGAKAIFSPYCPLDEGKRPHNCFPIPLGYNGSIIDVPFVEIDRRMYEVFFSGNIHKRRISFFLHAAILKYWRKVKLGFGSPMIDDKLVFTRKFTGGLAPEEYSEILMNTKIALVPEGYLSNISFRFFEAVRFGCIVITPKLYNYWFFKDFPGIEINHWRELHRKINYLTKNPSEFKEIQKKMLEYYQKNCSEKAVSEYILSHI